MGIFYFFHKGKMGKETSVPNSGLCVQSSVLQSVAQKENCFPAHNKDAEQALLHDVTLALNGFCSVCAEQRQKLVHLGSIWQFPLSLMTLIAHLLGSLTWEDQE